MRVRRAGSLVILLEGDQFVFHNYLRQTTFLANSMALEIVRRHGGWTDLEAVCASLSAYSRGSVERAVGQLVDLGALVSEGSDAASLDEAFAEAWLWGPLTAAYHFSTRVGEFMSDEAGGEMLRELVKTTPSPPLYETSARPRFDVALPIRRDFPEPFLTMTRRRTNRTMLEAPVTLGQISDCFLFSLAITAVIEDPDIVDLPLKMTPSGGARNPYEGYLLARNVEGLTPGVYHYSAMERTLGLVRPGPPPPFPDLMAGQDWTATAAALILLVANFERPMWKYHDGTAYRVTAIEAGHIAQNIMLVATHHGLVANPTGAMDFARVEETVGVGGPTKAALYALAIGAPGRSEGEVPA